MSQTERIEQPRYASFNDHRQQPRRLGGPQDNSFQQSWPAPQSQNPFRRYWQGLSRGYKIVFLAVAVGIVGIVVLINVLITASLESANSQKYKACEAAMQTEGYKGDELKAAVQFCVNYP
jgi:hypothetical protein